MAETKRTIKTSRGRREWKVRGEGGGWLARRFGHPSPPTDGCLHAWHGQETKLSKLVVIFTIWQYGWWQSQSERVLHKNVYFYSEVPCAVNTTSGECCRFPFKYKDVSYQDCTKADHHRPWCSLDPVFKGRWGDCGRCDLLFSLKNLKTPPSLELNHTIPNSAFIHSADIFWRNGSWGEL